MPKMRLALVFGLVIVVGSILLWFWSKQAIPVRKNLVVFNPSGCFLPCVAGVIAGDTDFQRVETIIQSQVPNAKRINESEFWVSQENTDGRLLLSVQSGDPRDGHYVHRIDLNTMDRSGITITTLGELFDAGFVPIQVFRSRVSGPNTVNLLLVLGEKRQIIARIAPTGKVEPTTSVISLSVLAPQNREDLLGDIRAIGHWDYEIKWDGYGSIDRYFK